MAISTTRTFICSLEESALLLRAAGHHLRENDQETAGDLYVLKAQDVRRRAEFVHQALIVQKNGEVTAKPASINTEG